MKIMALRMFNLPNLLTASNLMCGVFSIIACLIGRIDLVPYAIFIAALCDFLDGFVARKLNQTGPLGKELDSLADMVTFGVAPGILMFVVLVLCGAQDWVSRTNPGKLVIEASDMGNIQTIVKYWLDVYFKAFFYNPSGNSVFFTRFFLFLPWVALIIPFMSMFRLAKFNIDTRQSEGFLGLNTPANTLFFCMFPLLLVRSFQHPELYVYAKLALSYQIPMVLIVLFSVLLITEIPFFSFKFKSFGFKGNEVRYSFLLISLVILVSFGLWSIGLIVLLYLLISVIYSLLNKQIV